MITAPPQTHAGRMLIVAALLTTLLTAPGTASAQCGAPVDTAQALAAAESVFVGRVRSVDDLSRIAQMEVLSVWKGRDLPQRVEVRGTSSPDAPVAGSDARFDVGATYLVVPENRRQPFLATACSATQRYNNPPNLVPLTYQDAVGAETGRSALPDEDGPSEEAQLTGSVLPLLGAIALIALTWFAIAALRSRAPQRLASVAGKTESRRPTQAQPKQRRRRGRRRDFARDTAGASRATRRNLRRGRRGFGGYRRRQSRQVAAARKARGSTDTS